MITMPSFGSCQDRLRLACKSASEKLAELIYTCWADAGSPDPRTNIFDNQQPINDFVLHQNYPNPFNSQTNITFALQMQNEVSITIFNLKGQMVAEIFRGISEPGYHTISWNAGSVGAGMYIIKLEVGSFVDTKKYLLLK